MYIVSIFLLFPVALILIRDVPADTCRDSNVDFSTKQQQNYYIDSTPLYYVARDLLDLPVDLL